MATKLPNGKWRTAVLIGKDPYGKRQYISFIGETKGEADFLALQYKTKNESIAKKNITLSFAIDLYIENFSKRGSPTTVDGYKKIKRCYCTELLSCMLFNITEKQLQAHADRLAARVSSKTTREAIAFIKTVLKANGIRLGEIKLPKKKKATYKTPSPENMKNIIASLKGDDLELPVLLASWLTLTRSECAGLRWSDLKGNVLHVARSMVFANGTTHIKEPKTEDRDRYLLVPEYILQLMQKRKEAEDSEFIVNMSPDKISDRFRVHMEKHPELEYCSFHELRHFAASVGLLLNIPNKYMQKRGGWSTDVIMKNVYQQIFDEAEKQVTSKIDSFYEEHIL